VPIALWPEAFEHGFLGFLELKKHRGTVAAHEQADGAERAHAPDPDSLERSILERVSLEQTQPLRRKALLVGSKHVVSIDAPPRVTRLLEMIDRRWFVGDLGAFGQMREIVILLEAVCGLGDDGVELPSQRWILDVF